MPFHPGSAPFLLSAFEISAFPIKSSGRPTLAPCPAIAAWATAEADSSLGKPPPKATRVPAGTAEHHSALKQHLEWPRKGARGAKTRALAIFGGSVSYHLPGEVWHGLKTGKEACVFASFARFLGN
jgi:hypothetical protein